MLWSVHKNYVNPWQGPAPPILTLEMVSSNVIFMMNVQRSDSPCSIMINRVVLYNYNTDSISKYWKSGLKKTNLHSHTNVFGQT